MKFGSFSIILNDNEYNKFGFKTKNNNDLLKITQLKNHHNRECIIGNKFLTNTNDYVIKIYKNTLVDITNTKFLEYLKDGVSKYDTDKINKIFETKFLNDQKLQGYFVENLGDIDLFDTLTNLIKLEVNIWIIDTYKRINKFVLQMCGVLKYLQSNKIGHFDIKPENIIYNNNQMMIPFEKRFKLIDFGFAEKYPFQKYTNNLCGSTNYTPYNSSKKDNYSWVIKEKVNDWIYNPIQKKYIHYINSSYNDDPGLIYKTDIYSMGIVFNQLIHYVNGYMKLKNKQQINNREVFILIQNMTHKDIEKRFTPIDCTNYLNNFKLLFR